MFDSSLPFSLLTIKYENDPSFHIKTFVYRIKTSAGNYIVNLEEYIKNMFVLKFYPTRYKRREDKYEILTNDNVMHKVIGTSLQIFMQHLKTTPEASLGFIASASSIGSFKEAQENNQRFRIYKQIMQNFFGYKTFVHFVDIINSAYLMSNKANSVPEFIALMQEQFRDMYPKMFNLKFTEV